MFIPTDDPGVEALTAAIHQGQTAVVQAMLAARPELATAHFGGESADGMGRTALGRQR